jgi:two-component system OmpR family sensor kinase/two-component system sensor histidine kinase BaeS
VLAGIATVGRSLRRLAAPVADVIDAVGKVADGDLSVRVQERGPRETRRLARSFNAMTERLRASEEERRRLLADVSHELRTPLSVVQGELEALLDGVHPADETHLRAILDETAVLSRLIEDLRTLSVAEAGALALHREPTDLGTLAREVTASLAPQAQAAGVSVETAAAAGLPEADVDPVRVREILSNLVSNALRYTPRGGRVSVDVSADGTSALAVTVADTGVGIPAESLARIFDRFYKSPESRGAGLGLPIAKQLVEAHGGTIHATSAPGSGTAIRFTLPLAT